MMKKILIVTISLIALIALLGAGYFFIFQNPKVIVSAENAADQLSTSVSLKSFQGVLTDVIENVGAETKEVLSGITDPPSEKKAPDYSAANQNNPDESFSFAIIGDTQRFEMNNPKGYFQRAIASVRKINPDKVFAVGDLIDNCDGENACAKKYADWKNIVGNLMPKTFATQGNHDRTGDDKTDNEWRSSFDFPINGPSEFSEQVFSFDFKNSHFVVLNSDKPKEHSINGDQRAWLEKDLAANTKENIFIFFHEPAYPVSSKITESLDVEPSERNALWQIIDKYNVTAVFNGHEHIVSRRKIDSKVFPQAKNSIYQFVFANTDSFDHDLPQPGVAEYSNQGQGRFGIVKVNGKEITVETHGPDGSLLNTFTFSN